MRRDFLTYSGTLCASWLQEEIITVDTIGIERLPRRYALRYVQITVLEARKKITLSDFKAERITCADYTKITQLDSKGEIAKIDEISLCMLSECMQEVFEDGTKRDRRLWIGNLRLAALTNYYTFKNMDIVKSRLYLFAAFDNDETLPSFVFTNPKIETGDAHILSYALLYTQALCDYFEHTGDKEVTLDLFDTAKRQIDGAKKCLMKTVL